MTRESGFTLIELMVAVTIGMIVVLAGFALLDTSVTLTGKVDDRVDSASRARVAMEQITRELRAQVCIPNASGPTASIIAGDATFTTNDYGVYFTDFVGSGTLAGYHPQRHFIVWNPANNTITDKTWNSTGDPKNPTWPAQPSIVSTLATNVVQEGQNVPIFEYFPIQSTGQIDFGHPLANPGTNQALSAAETLQVAAVRVRFTARANRSTSTAQATTLEDDAFIPTWDPNAAGGPAAPDCT